MKYPCNLIRDLLPLYIDGVCSDESNVCVEEHLKECASCREYLTSIEATKCVDMVESNDETFERKKRNSYVSLKKKIRKGQIIVSLFACLSLLVIFLVSVNILKNYKEAIEYDGNIRVSMVDGDLVGRLQGNQVEQFKIKRVETKWGEEERVYLFFYMVSSKWNDLMTDDDVFSEILICSNDKGAEEVDCVYYYTGDYTGLENLDESSLMKVIDSSVLLWDK